MFPTQQPINLISVRGTPYVVLASDQNFVEQSAKHGTIELETYIANLPCVKALREADVVWDVGAFIGDTALIFAKRGCEVLAFEAQPDAYCAAVINLREHPFAQVINLPVGDGSKVRLNQDPLVGNPGTRTVSVDDDGVPTVRLDDIAGVPPTLIKIDVEGSEAAVLRGAERVLREHGPKLLIELYPEMLERHGSGVQEVYDLLTAAGYQWETVIGEQNSVRWDILATKAKHGKA